MKGSKSNSETGEGAGYWMLKVLSGILILVLLLVHFIVNHISPPESLLSWQGVVDYFANPWIVFMEICFLVVVVTHALTGLRSIILDLNPRSSVMAVIDKMLVVVGFLAAGYGIWLALTVASFN